MTHVPPPPIPRSPGPPLPGPTTLIEELWSSSQYGIPEGETLYVPRNYCAVIMHQGSILYVLSPASYLLARHTFPQLSPARVRAGERPMLLGSVYLVRTDDVVIPWELPITTPGRWNEGATCEVVRGRYGLRITNPPQLLQAIYRQLHEAAAESSSMKSFQLARYPKDTHRTAAAHLAEGTNAIALPYLADALETLQTSLKRENRSIAYNPGAAQDLIGKAVAPHLNGYGTHLSLLFIDSVSVATPMPCQSCGSFKRPTGDVSFSSNASLIYIRYTWTKKGCFCVWCALKYFIGYTLVILTAGWWSLIGLIFSPFLLGFNILNLCKALARYRMPTPPEDP